MRILCLHGIGSNAETFKLQTAVLRSLLDDVEFEFLQAGVPRLRPSGPDTGVIPVAETLDNALGYQWYDALKPESLLEAEMDMLHLIEENGPFDGVLGYSQGSQFAAQVLLRHAELYPFATAEERPFRFAIFVSGLTPWDAFETPDGCEILPASQQNRAMKIFQYMFQVPLKTTPSVKIQLLPDGRQAVTNDGFAYTQYDDQRDGVLIDVPTLHVRSTKDHFDSSVLLGLCDPETRSEYVHDNGHNFPKGFQEVNDMARLIRATASIY